MQTQTMPHLHFPSSQEGAQAAQPEDLRAEPQVAHRQLLQTQKGTNVNSNVK